MKKKIVKTGLHEAELLEVRHDGAVAEVGVVHPEIRRRNLLPASIYDKNSIGLSYVRQSQLSCMKNRIVQTGLYEAELLEVGHDGAVAEVKVIHPQIRRRNLIGASIYDKCSVGPSIRPVCTR